MSQIPFPGDDYLIKVGKVLYSMSYIEWGIIGDLPHLKNHKFANDYIEKLLGMTTGALANELAKQAMHVCDQDISVWLDTAAKSLGKIVETRNDIVHAHCATCSGKQSLYRTKKRKEITEDMLDSFIQELSDISSCISNVRVLFNKQSL